MLYGGNENLAVTNLARLGGALYCLNCTVEPGFGDDNFHLGFWQELDDVVSATIEFRVSLLPTEALNIGDGHALYTKIQKGRTHVIELIRLEGCGDQFNGTLRI